MGEALEVNDAFLVEIVMILHSGRIFSREARRVGTVGLVCMGFCWSTGKNSTNGTVEWPVYFEYGLRSALPSTYPPHPTQKTSATGVESNILREKTFLMLFKFFLEFLWIVNI